MTVYERCEVVLSGPYLNSLVEIQEKQGLENIPQTVRHILREYFKDHDVEFKPKKRRWKKG